MSHILDATAKRLFAMAIADDRCGEILQHLFDGGGVTFTPGGQLILIPANLIQELSDGASA